MVVLFCEKLFSNRKNEMVSIQELFWLDRPQCWEQTEQTKSTNGSHVALPFVQAYFEMLPSQLYTV